MKLSGTRLLQKPSVHCLLFIVVGALLYFCTLPYPFVFDDNTYLVNNPLIRDDARFLELGNIKAFASFYLPRVDNPDVVVNFILRPFAYLTFRVNYLLGGLNPAGYRVFNIAVHIANAIIWYLLVSTVIRRRNDGVAPQGNALVIPFFSALLFLVHPLQTESVTYIIQRFTSLGAFFYLATMLLYLRSGGSGSVSVRTAAYLGSILTLVVGMLTKECVFTAPFALLMMDGLLLRKPLRPSLLRLVPHFACLSITPVLMRVISGVTSGATALGSTLNIVNSAGISPHDYAVSQVRVILTYFRLLVLPYGQNIDPDYPLYRSAFQPEIVIALLIFGAFIAAGIALLRRRGQSLTGDLTAFSIFWFLLSISISSSIVPLPDLMAEHRAYLPSLAVFTGLVSQLESIRCRLTPAGAGRLLAGLLVVASTYAVLTEARNHAYGSRLSLWSDTVAKSPRKARPYLALGNVYLDGHQSEAAIPYLKKAVEINPRYVEAYLSLGTAYKELVLLDDAVALYEAALRQVGNDSRILSNLATAYAKTYQLDKAIETANRAIGLAGSDITLYLILAELYYQAGDYVRARHTLLVAEELDAADPLVDLSAAIGYVRGYYDASSE